ncbi:MAG: hypothetical protein JSU08_11165 [Acidobacteria bacterium]|nr:hypothetical protein [Acidobacteriota bacterium]
MSQTLPDNDALDQVFRGPASISALIRPLRHVDPAVAAGVLATLALVDGAIRRRRLTRAWAWAGAQGLSGARRVRLALALLANHGRYVAQEAMFGIPSQAELRESSVVLGTEHLARLAGGALLVGMHVGPPRIWLVLRTHGYPLTFALRAQAGSGERWDAWQREGVIIGLPTGGDVASRTQVLFRLRQLLAAGRHVALTADGPVGRELFRLPLPGYAPIVRAGWFTLRRQLRVPVLPMLMHEEGSRRVVTIHRPLPPSVGDERADAAACQAVLTEILGAYVREHPEQCRYLAFPPWDK